MGRDALVFGTWVAGVDRHRLASVDAVVGAPQGGVDGLGVGASVLDYSKFNLTNGLRSELDLLILVSAASGGLAAYLYVKANPAPKA